MVEVVEAVLVAGGKKKRIVVGMARFEEQCLQRSCPRSEMILVSLYDSVALIVVEVLRMEQGAPRVLEADRSQLQLRPFDLDSTIPQDHRARLLWRAVETLDLSAFYERIKARVGIAGRPPGDPKVFVTLTCHAGRAGTKGAIGVWSCSGGRTLITRRPDRDHRQVASREWK